MWDHVPPVPLVILRAPGRVIFPAGQVIAAAAQTLIRPHHRRVAFRAQTGDELHRGVWRLEDAFARDPANVRAAVKTVIKLAHAGKKSGRHCGWSETESFSYPR